MTEMISIGQIIDKTFHLYQKHFLAYAKHGLWLFVTLPLSIVILEPIVHLFSNDIFTIAIIVFSALLLNVVVAIVAGNFVSNGFIFSTIAFDAGKEIDGSTMRKNAWSRLGAACVQSILTVGLMLSAVLLILPALVLFGAASWSETPGVALPALGMFLMFAGGVAAIILIVWFAVIVPFAPMSLIVEKKGPVAALKAAFALVRGRWWATMVRVLVPKLTFGVILAFVQMLVVFFFFVVTAAFAPMSEIVGETSTSITLYVLQSIAVLLVTAVTTPAFVIADYYVYSDLAATRRAS